MTTYTPKLQLEKPERGSLNWDVLVNSNFDKMDNSVIVDRLAIPTVIEPLQLFKGGNLAPNTTYYYRIVACSINGKTTGSKEVSITTTDIDKKIFISWLYDEHAVTYEIYRSESSGNEKLLKSDIEATSYTDTGADTPGAEDVPVVNTATINITIPNDLIVQGSLRVTGEHSNISKALSIGSITHVEGARLAISGWSLGGNEDLELLISSANLADNKRDMITWKTNADVKTVSIGTKQISAGYYKFFIGTYSGESISEILSVLPSGVSILGETTVAKLVLSSTQTIEPTIFGMGHLDNTAYLIDTDYTIATDSIIMIRATCSSGAENYMSLNCSIDGTIWAHVIVDGATRMLGASGTLAVPKGRTWRVSSSSFAGEVNCFIKAYHIG